MSLILMFKGRHMAEVAALRAELERVRGERDEALKERKAFKAAAETSSELFVQADADKAQLVAAEQRREALAVVRGEQLVEGGQTDSGRPQTECLRCRQLAERVATLQTSHEADTRELHDLRQGATA